jgi:hypothetical protein
MRGAGWNLDPCRAGFKPRRKQMLVSLLTTCACPPDFWRAESPAQLPPCGVEVRAFRQGPLVAAFLIYGTGIRNRAKWLKTLDRDPV